MNKFDYRFDTNGSSALKPQAYNRRSLSLVEGGRTELAAGSRRARISAREAIDWYYSANDPVSVAAPMGDRERLACVAVFALISAMVVLSWALGPVL